ncbi:MAG: hypothetical protein R3D26_11290 [Cyanobacteriota/Melainabacteria group bacterium]
MLAGEVKEVVLLVSPLSLGIETMVVSSQTGGEELYTLPQV